MVVIIIVVCLPDSNKQQTRQTLEAAWNAVDTQYYFVSITFSNDIWFDSSSPKIVVFGLDLLAALWLPTRNVQVDHMIAGLTEQVWVIKLVSICLQQRSRHSPTVFLMSMGISTQLWFTINVSFPYTYNNGYERCKYYSTISIDLWIFVDLENSAEFSSRWLPCASRWLRVCVCSLQYFRIFSEFLDI